MPTLLHSLNFTEAHKAGALASQIAFGLLMVGATAMLLLGAVLTFGADAAASDSFDLIATF
jgi:hypothetical protein